MIQPIIRTAESQRRARSTWNNIVSRHYSDQRAELRHQQSRQQIRADIEAAREKATKKPTTHVAQISKSAVVQPH